jgi:hypothetical protein
MTSSFQMQHSAMLLNYSGISFISGAVNHGFSVANAHSGLPQWASSFL